MEVVCNWREEEGDQEPVVCHRGRRRMIKNSKTRGDNVFVDATRGLELGVRDERCRRIQSVLEHPKVRWRVEGGIEGSSTKNVAPEISRETFSPSHEITIFRNEGNALCARAYQRWPGPDVAKSLGVSNSGLKNANDSSGVRTTMATTL